MLKVLIIEDNRKLAELLSAFLKKKGFEVDVAYDDISAVRSFVGKSYDLLLADTELQRMNGAEVCKKIRTTARGRAVPIIMMSGTIKDPSAIEKLKYEIHLSGFLTKPFSSESLYSLMVASLQGPAPRPASPEPEKTIEKQLSSIKGDLQKIPFEQVLLYLNDKSGTGTLTVTRESERRKFLFLGGAPVDIEPCSDEDAFGNYLAQKKLIDAAELREYAERRKRQGDDPRDLFIKMGCLDPQRFREESRTYLLDRLIECFAWRSGAVLFEWGVTFLKTSRVSSISMPSLMYRGFKAHLSPSAISSFLADRGGLYVARNANFYEYQNQLAAELSEPERLDLINGLKTCSELMTAFEEEDAGTALYTLDYLKALAYSAVPNKSESSPPFPVRERESKKPSEEPEKYEDLGGELSDLADTLGSLGDLKRPRETAVEPEGLSALEEGLKKQWESMKDKNYYELFGMKANNFSFDKLKKSYFDLTRTYGPDKFFTSSGEIIGLAEEFLSKISNAYETLSNVVSKENYDELISSHEHAPAGEEDKEFYEQIQFQSGKVFLEQGQFESAEKAFTNCMNINDDKAEYYAYLALAIYSNSANKGSPASIKRAKDLVNKSLQMGKLSIAHALKGTIYLDEGGLNFAEAEFNKALKLNPSNKTALKKLEFIKQKREEEKKGLFQRIFR